MLTGVIEYWFSDIFSILFGKGAGVLKAHPVMHPYKINYTISSVPNFFVQFGVQYGVIGVMYFTIVLYRQLKKMENVHFAALLTFAFLYLMQRPIDPIFLMFVAVLPLTKKS